MWQKGLPAGVYMRSRHRYEKLKGWKKVPFVNHGKHYLNQGEHAPHDLIDVCARAPCFFRETDDKKDERCKLQGNSR